MKHEKVIRMVACENCSRLVNMEKINLLPGKILCKRCLIGHTLARWLKTEPFFKHNLNYDNRMLEKPVR